MKKIESSKKLKKPNNHCNARWVIFRNITINNLVLHDMLENEIKKDSQMKQGSNKMSLILLISFSDIKPPRTKASPSEIKMKAIKRIDRTILALKKKIYKAKYTK